jgi:hypothetical protein
MNLPDEVKNELTPLTRSSIQALACSPGRPVSHASWASTGVGGDVVGGNALRFDANLFNRRKRCTIKCIPRIAFGN